jgi:hypothetical protein
MAQIIFAARFSFFISLIVARSTRLSTLVGNTRVLSRYF